MALTTQGWPIIGWARTAVAAVQGALAKCQPHDLAAPLVHHLLTQTGLQPQAIDAVVLGNALGAGGNPARMLALAAGLPENTPALTIDTQCCSGLDAVTQACGLLALGQAQIVLAGGAEAWSRAPLRMTRPSNPNAIAQPYECPAFAPWPERDPDMLDAAAHAATILGLSRATQDEYAVHSHQQAHLHAASMADEIVPVAGVSQDTYPRPMSMERATRMPTVRSGHGTQGTDCGLSRLTISPKADGAALIMLASPEACQRLGLQPRALWLGASTIGGAPEVPMLCAQQATQKLLHRHALHPQALSVIELHDAFAVQGLAFAQALGLPWHCLNVQGGGLARGHPIGASGAIALVRALAQCSMAPEQHPTYALVSIAGAGGLGSAALLQAPYAEPSRN